MEPNVDGLWLVKQNARTRPDFSVILTDSKYTGGVNLLGNPIIEASVNMEHSDFSKVINLEPPLYFYPLIPNHSRKYILVISITTITIGKNKGGIRIEGAFRFD
jgi:hypothetical protein